MMKRRVLALALVLAVLAAFPLGAAATELGEDVLPTLKALEIMVGDGSGNLNLSAPVTRSEFAKLLIASSSYKDALGGQGAGYSLFTDVKSSHWASEYIKLCLDQGWMIGYTDGSFRPDNTVTLEEACTAALRLLGFDSSNLSGSFPAAQLNKASAVGLRDKVDAVQGQQLTRQDCARLFYNLLTCKTAQGQVYATTLGYKLDEDEDVDYMAVVREDLEGPYICIGATPALGFTPTVTYLNDKLVSSLNWQADDIYYYAKGYLWVYRDQVFGQINTVTSNGFQPTGVNVDGKNYTLGSGAVRDQIAALGSHAAGTTVTLLLGMDAQVAAARVVNGPVISDGVQSLGFVPKTVYRDGERSANAALAKNDVYYYDETSQTLWLCTDQVSGKIEALTPSALSPSAVTISGKSYTLGNDELRRELSSLNGKWTGKFVTLLFGMDDTVVGILTGDEVEATYYGVVQSSSKVAQDGSVEQQVKFTGTDGRSHTFSTTNLTHDYDAGDLVQANISDGSVTISPLTARYFSGAVNQGASRAGNYTFADDLEILDAAEDGTAVTVDAATLSGLTLGNSTVRFYHLNTQGELDRLILDDATGALWSYGYLVSLEQQGTGMNASARYTLMLDGQIHNINVSGTTYPVTARQGVAVRMTSENAIGAMQSLKSVKLTSVGKTTAYTSNQTFSLADRVSVYLRDSEGDYHAVELTDVNSGDYTLTGYYDAAQKLIRVIVAQKG